LTLGKSSTIIKVIDKKIVVKRDTKNKRTNSIRINRCKDERLEEQLEKLEEQVRVWINGQVVSNFQF